MREIYAGDTVYSTKFGAGGYATVLKVNGDEVLIKLEDYGGAIAKVDRKYLKESADADYDDWLKDRETEAELYPSKPVDI